MVVCQDFLLVIESFDYNSHKEVQEEKADYEDGQEDVGDEEPVFVVDRRFVDAFSIHG